jgi:hypothetical protein
VRLRVAAVAGVVVLSVVALLVVIWPSNPDRTEKILEVYAEQLGLTEEEARQERERAVDLANVYCSIEPANLVDFMKRSTSPVEDAVKYARAACPSTAREFEAAVRAAEPADVSDPPIRADLIVTLDADLSAPEIRSLGFAILGLRGVEDVQGDPDELVVQLDEGADAERAATAIRELAGVEAVDRA